LAAEAGSRLVFLVEFFSDRRHLTAFEYSHSKVHSANFPANLDLHPEQVAAFIQQCLKSAIPKQLTVQGLEVEDETVV
jgi:hypothetical protein